MWCSHNTLSGPRSFGACTLTQQTHTIVLSQVKTFPLEPGPLISPRAPSPIPTAPELCAAQAKSSTGAHLPGQPQGDVAFLSRVHNLHLEVVAAGAQWVPGLSQPHVNDALALAQVLQQLWGKCRGTGGRLIPALETRSQGSLGTSFLCLTKNSS